MDEQNPELALVLDRLRELERKPPNRANRLLVSHLKCQTSQTLSRAVAQAAGNASSSGGPVLDAPSEILPPLA